MSADITSQKVTEKQLQNSLQENSGLLQELQHRVKNSFIMITGMISLVKNSNGSDEVKKAFSEIESHIQAVSELYSILYESKSVDTVSLNEYIGKVASTFPRLSDNITLTTEFDPVTVTVRKAVPLGIITAELLTNTVKYAFPGNNKGKIEISLKMNNERCSLEISDDGIGFADGFDISSTETIGLSIVKSLIKQIGGTLTVESRTGVKYHISFPIN